MHSDLVKIAFQIAATEDTDDWVETMWAIPQDDGTYILDNSPFDVYGISWRDRVAAKREHGLLVFEKVVERGGHSTYRVKLNRGAGHSQFLKYWPRLGLLGCTYEGGGGGRRLYSIDVPPSAPVTDVYQYLQEVENEGAWEFEEAHYFDPGA